MSLKVGESGKIIRVAAAYDMSANTDITLSLENPAGTITTRTKSAGQITLGAGVIDPVLGNLAANTYIEYKTLATDFTVVGSWKLSLTFTNTGTTPQTIYIGDVATFAVNATGL